MSPTLPLRSNSVLPEPNVVPFRSTSNPKRGCPPHPPFVPFIPQDNIPGLTFTTEPFTETRTTHHHPVNLLSTTYYRELDYHDSNEPEPDFLPFDESETQSTPFQSQHSEHQHGTPSWVTASRNRNRNPHGAPKKPIDFEFIASMAHQRRRQTHGTSSDGASTTSGSLALLGSPVSISPSIFSPSSELSVLSPGPAVQFPPTPVFRDEGPEELFMQRGESAPGMNLGNSHSRPWGQRDSHMHPSGSNSSYS